MNIYILFWVKSFLLTHPICETKHHVYIYFKMRMKAKTYEIKNLVGFRVSGLGFKP
jgi:hypothetical protein